MKYPRYTRDQNRRCKLTEDQIKEVRKRRKKGETYASIAKDFGVTINAVYYWSIPDKVRKQKNREYAERQKAKGYPKKDSIAYAGYRKRKKATTPAVTKYDNDRSRRWYQKRKKQLAKYAKEYRKKNIEKIREINRRWTRKNRDLVNKRQRQRYWRKKNIDG